MSTRRAFEETTVSADKTKAEIRAMLLKYGAEQFGIIEGPGRAVIGFTAHGRTVRIEVPVPDPQRPPLPAPDARSRGAKAVQAALDQEERRIWRAVRLWIFGQLEAIRSSIRTFEIAFLSDTVLPSGQTFSEWAEPQIERQVAAGEMPALLPPRLPPGD